jgi:hypothetical protein
MTDTVRKPGAEGQGQGGRCPICGKPTQHAVRPFCSARCADIDLGRWVSGGYVIAGGQSDADEDGDEGFAKEAGPLDRGAGDDDGESQ